MAAQLSTAQNESEVDLSRFFVTAIIVTHDGAAWLPEVIAALSSQTRRIDRIIAVDTGSVDISPKLLPSRRRNNWWHPQIARPVERRFA